MSVHFILLDQWIGILSMIFSLNGKESQVSSLYPNLATGFASKVFIRVYIVIVSIICLVTWQRWLMASRRPPNFELD